MLSGARIDGRQVSVRLVALRPQLLVAIDGVVHRLSGTAGEGVFSLELDGIRHSGWLCRSGGTVFVRLHGRTHLIEEAHVAHAGLEGAADSEVRASMPGVVVTVQCQPGQSVSAGEPLLTLESMKLQMTVVARHAATVRAVHVVPEAVFERGALLVSFESGEPAA